MDRKKAKLFLTAKENGDNISQFEITNEMYFLDLLYRYGLVISSDLDIYTVDSILKQYIKQEYLDGDYLDTMFNMLKTEYHNHAFRHDKLHIDYDCKECEKFLVSDITCTIL